MRAGSALASALLAGLAACTSAPPPVVGLRRTPAGPGPRVVFDLQARPVPLLPLPNDLLTRPDPSTPTGRRVAVSTDAPTLFERNERIHLNQLDGFGTFAPITVPFDEPLDLDTAVAAPSTAPPTLLVVNLNPRSPAYGLPVPLDLGAGFYPYTITPTAMFPGDPDDRTDNLLFPMDNTAFWKGGMRRVDFYERATRTLLLRPLYPLDEDSRYAVVLTDGLLGVDGRPVHSPFPWVHHLSQTADLEAAIPVFQRLGIAVDHIAFAWTFTTQSVTALLDSARRGLDGEGPLAWLRRDFPQGDLTVSRLEVPYEGNTNPFLLPGRAVGDLVQFALGIAAPFLGNLQVEQFDPIARMESVDYFVLGSIRSPSFLTGFPPGPMPPGVAQGGVRAHPDRVPFWITVPRPSAYNGWAEPPYPVVLVGHGLGGSRTTVLAFANRLARFGLATAGIDAVGHGPDTVVGYLMHPDVVRSMASEAFKALNPNAGSTPNAEPFIKSILSTALEKLGIEIDAGLDWDAYFRELDALPLLQALEEGRAWDTDGDGSPDSGTEFFTADSFRTRDFIQQTVVDEMFLGRVLRALGRTQRPGDPGCTEVLRRAGALPPGGYQGPGLEGGDFNCDGVADLGGGGSPAGYIGVSMGGILGSVLTGADPLIRRAVLSVPGGGLTDLALKSSLVIGDAGRPIYAHALGPILHLDAPDDPKGDDFLRVDGDARTLDPVRLSLVPGEPVLLVNPRLAVRKALTAGPDGSLYGSVAADPSDLLEILPVHRPADERSFRLRPDEWGLGLSRNSSDLREFLNLSQTILEPGDPVNWALRWNSDRAEGRWNRPLPGTPDRQVLVQACLRDTIVPNSTGAALGRAAGFLSLPRNRTLIDLGVMVGQWTPTSPWPGPADALTLPPETLVAGSGMRWHMGNGHAYIVLPTPPPVDYASLAQIQAGYLLKCGELLDEGNPSDRARLLTEPVGPITCP